MKLTKEQAEILLAAQAGPKFREFLEVMSSIADQDVKQLTAGPLPSDRSNFHAGRANMMVEIIDTLKSSRETLDQYENQT